MNNRIKKIDNPDEFVFNSILRDYLRRNNPPKFSAKILSELESRGGSESDSQSDDDRSSILAFSHSDLDEALGAAQADLDYAVFSPPVQDGSQQGKKSRKYRLEPYFWEYRSFRQIVGLAALAASLGGVFAGYQAWKQADPENNIAKVLSNLPSISYSSTDGKTAEDRAEDLAQVEVKSDPPDVASVNAGAIAPTPKIVQVAKPTRKIFVQPEPLETNKLTEIVNSQLHQVWINHGVEPKLVQTDGELWLNRATEGILGRAPTITESELFRQEKGDDRFEKTVQSLVQSEEFYQHWSRLIAENFLAQSITSTSRRELSDLVAWINSELTRGTPIGQIERQLVEIGFDESDPNRDAKLILFNDTRSRLSSIEQEVRGLEKSLLLRPSNKDSSFAHLANSVLHATGNGTASCVQCHNSESSVMSTITLPDEQIAKQFWNFAAAIKMVAKSRERPTVELSKEDQELFYESTDGKLLLASPTITLSKDDGAQAALEQSDAVSNQATIHEWIEQSSLARNGLVETVWLKMLQQPLVPAFKLTEDEADTERRDLKNLLAKQLQATGDIKSIVQSIALSDAYFAPEANLTKNWYLTSSDAKLSQYHKGARLFSFVPVETPRTLLHRPKSTTTIAKWLEVEKRRGFDTGTLAQPRSRSKPQNSPQSGRTEFEDIDQVRFLVSAARPYYGLERLANQLADSNLEWNDKVNHLYLLIKGRYPMQSERFDANYTLELVQQNQFKALIYICTAQLGSY